MDSIGHDNTQLPLSRQPVFSVFMDFRVKRTSKTHLKFTARFICSFQISITNDKQTIREKTHFFLNISFGSLNKYSL